MTNIPNVTLSNGVRMPASVFGVYQMRDAAECQKAVESAIAVGYGICQDKFPVFSQKKR